MKYRFIRDHQHRYPIRTLCRVLGVHRSGFYAWCREPLSPRQHENQRLLQQIQQHWLASGRVYGYRKVHHDLRDAGESCSRHRVARLMRQAGLKAQVGYKRRPRPRGGPAAVVAPNQLQQQFDVEAPNRVWVTDITYIRTHEGWLYLAAVLDLFSRQVVGWSMQSRMTCDLVMQALLMAVWRRRPRQTVTVHSDQGSQYTSHDWQRFLQQHNLTASMSRRGNCHDNAVAESFFQLLKRERIRRRTYRTRDEARADVFDYIELFYNTKRRHGYNEDQSPADYEKQYFMRLESV